MFDLEPVLAESDYRGAFTHALARFRRRSLIVLFTDLVEQAVGESLLPALPLLVRHHIVLIAAVRDPDVVGWATAPPDDASEAYRATAATLALAERDRAIARLRGLGAIVVDAPPGQLAPQLADTYLELKARGGLVGPARRAASLRRSDASSAQVDRGARLREPVRSIPVASPGCGTHGATRCAVARRCRALDLRHRPARPGQRGTRRSSGSAAAQRPRGLVARWRRSCSPKAPV